MEGFVQEFVLPLLYSMLVAIVPVLAGFATSAIRQWGKRQKREWIESITWEVTESIDRAVDMVEQTFSEELRDANGKLSPNDAADAFNRATRAAYAQMSGETIEDFIRLVGGSDQAAEAVNSMVESSVRRKKGQRRSAADFVLTNGSQ